MPVTNVLMDTDSPRGSKLDPEMQDEIAALGPGLEDGEVTEDAIAVGAVTRDKIGPGAVGSTQLDNGAVQEAHMAPASVNSAAIKDDALLGRHAGQGIVSAVDADGEYIESKNWHGTYAEYSAIVDKDPHITYYVAVP